MGKEIKSKTHKGIRDPLKQLQKAREKQRNKINDCPKDPNVQKEARKFEAIHNYSLEKKKRKKYKKDQLLDTARFIDRNVGFYPKDGKPFKTLPTLQQGESESSFNFMKRVGKATKMMIDESVFENKYQVDIKRSEDGKVESAQPWSDKEVQGGRGQNRRLKRKMWKSKKKLKKMEGKKKSQESINAKEGESANTEENLFKREIIPFGETVHQPPKLATEKLTKKLAEEKQLRSRNFLFTEGLGREESPNDGESSKLRGKVLEREREKAVLIYRQFKARQFDSSTQ